MKEFANDLFGFILDCLFPIYCLSCHKYGDYYLCNECFGFLEIAQYQICITCKKPSLSGLTHSGCKSPLSPDAVISLFYYDKALLSELIITGKYKFVKHIFAQLAEILNFQLGNNFDFLFDQTDLITVIPLHKFKKRWRNFNQTEILAKYLSEVRNISYCDLLEKIKYGKIQKDLSLHSRQQNIKGSFKIIDKTKIIGKQIILIDDVFTTGSTLIEATKILKRAGATKVYCLTLCRD